MKHCKYLFILFVIIISGSALFSKGSITKIIQKSKSMGDPAAIRYLASSLQNHPENFKINYRIGYLYQKMNRRTEALLYYKKALNKKKCHARAWNNAGNIYLDKDDVKQAELHYLKSIKCDSKQISAHYNLANLYRKNRNSKKAIFHYHVALNLDENHYKSHHNLGLIYLNALKNLNKKLKQKSNKKTSENLIINNEKNKQNNEEWKEISNKTEFHFSKSLSIKKNDVYSYYNRGRYYQTIGENAKAVKDYRRAYTLLPSGSRFRRILYKKIQQIR